MATDSMRSNNKGLWSHKTFHTALQHCHALRERLKVIQCRLEKWKCGLAGSRKTATCAWLSATWVLSRVTHLVTISHACTIRLWPTVNLTHGLLIELCPVTCQLLSRLRWQNNHEIKIYNHNSLCQAITMIKQKKSSLLEIILKWNNSKQTHCLTM